MFIGHHLCNSLFCFILWFFAMNGQLCKNMVCKNVWITSNYSSHSANNSKAKWKTFQQTILTEIIDMTFYFSLMHKLTNNIMADCFYKQEITSQNYWTNTSIHTQRLTAADSVHLEASYATIFIDYRLILYYKVFSMWIFISLTIKVW